VERNGRRWRRPTRNRGTRGHLRRDARTALCLTFPPAFQQTPRAWHETGFAARWRQLTPVGATGGHSVAGPSGRDRAVRELLPDGPTELTKRPFLRRRRQAFVHSRRWMVSGHGSTTRPRSIRDELTSRGCGGASIEIVGRHGSGHRCSNCALFRRGFSRAGRSASATNSRDHCGVACRDVVQRSSSC
jgi:hypothetical protein